jgi:hypothetical protein
MQSYTVTQFAFMRFAAAAALAALMLLHQHRRACTAEPPARALAGALLGCAGIFLTLLR